MGLTGWGQVKINPLAGKCSLPAIYVNDSVSDNLN